MEIWGPRLPSGWRYPVGRAAIRRLFRDVPGIQVHLAASNSRESGLVARARLLSPAQSMPLRPHLTIYAQRAGDFEAPEDFEQQVAPQVADFLQRQLALSDVERVDGLRELSVTWRRGRYSVEVTEL